MGVVHAAVVIFFGILLVLNAMDWLTTYIILGHYATKKPYKTLLPLWKTTRPGEWLMRRRGFRWIKPPKMGMCHWYDHELNPMFRWACKRSGMWPLGLGKLLPFIIISHNTYIALLYFPDKPLIYLAATFYGLCLLYVAVIVNNIAVLKKVLRSV